MDYTDKSLLDFRKQKSISVATTITDIKSSKIGELYEVKPIHDNIQRLCQLKLQGKALKEDTEPLPKHISKRVCDCLFEKNQKLRIIDLEKMVKNKVETPASGCITILDSYKMNKQTQSQKQSKKSSLKKQSKKSSLKKAV
jgi:hypothetical protein